MNLREQVQAVLPEHGYKVHGVISLAIGHNLEEIERDIDVEVTGNDALMLASAESEEAIARMIANLYFEEDIDEPEPTALIRDIANWQVSIKELRS